MLRSLRCSTKENGRRKKVDPKRRIIDQCRNKDSKGEVTATIKGSEATDKIKAMKPNLGHLRGTRASDVKPIIIMIIAVESDATTVQILAIMRITVQSLQWGEICKFYRSVY